MKAVERLRTLCREIASGLFKLLKESIIGFQLRLVTEISYNKKLYRVALVDNLLFIDDLEFSRIVAILEIGGGELTIQVAFFDKKDNEEAEYSIKLSKYPSDQRYDPFFLVNEDFTHHLLKCFEEEIKENTSKVESLVEDIVKRYGDMIYVSKSS